jgi:uncharacterized protein
MDTRNRIGSTVEEPGHVGGWRRIAGRRRRRVIGAAAALTVLVTVAGVLMLVPERILFGYRLHFSILELDRDRPLLPFDHWTADGLRLRSWHVPPQGGRPTIVYFAGRDGDIIHKPAHLVAAAEEGFGLLLAGYRGFGGNPGIPSEAPMHRDVIALLHQAERDGVTPNGTILYGYSMGSAFAASAAAHTAPLGVILEAPLSTFLAAVRLQAGPVPRFLVRTRFDNLARLPEIASPILLLAGDRDPITPPSFALALADANPGLTRVEIVPEANHFNIIRLGGYRAVEDFLKEIESPEQVETRFAARAEGWRWASLRRAGG